MRKLGLLLAAVVIGAATPAVAAFTTFTGNATAEANWRAAAGTFFLETFDSYAQGAPISSLPLLGVGFDLIFPTNGCTTCPPGYPAVYVHHTDNTPSNRQQLSNMPVGGSPNGNYNTADIMLRVLSGYSITALGFWNGDPQGPMAITVFDALNNMLGTVSAATNTGGGNTFAGFVSDTPFDHILFEGNTGDGYNHIDDLQTNAAIIAAPEPGVVGLFAVALLLLGLWPRAVPVLPSRGRANR